LTIYISLPKISRFEEAYNLTVPLPLPRLPTIYPLSNSSIHFLDEMILQRSTPFCCVRITSQRPLHYGQNYPRSYTCLYDFLALSTSVPNQILTSTLSNPLREYYFVIRLCKGLSNPRYRPNQWREARYFLPDPFIEEGFIEVLDNENGDKDLSRLMKLLKK
jgi:hypothetical protein